MILIFAVIVVVKVTVAIPNGTFVIIAALVGAWATGFVCAIGLRWLFDVREIEARKHPRGTAR